MFGICKKNKNINTNLLNWTLSHARYATWARRNTMHFEGKKVDVWIFFEAKMRADLFALNKYLSRALFGKWFVKGCKLIHIEEKGGFKINI